eukprot:jgi/Orpsp1_1/1180659/evm.model.c7180000074240.1
MILLWFFFFYLSVRADYYCVINNTGHSLSFRLIENHYDVIRYEFRSEMGGLIRKNNMSNNEIITLLPKEGIMLRAMYSYIKSGGNSVLELEDKSGSIVFDNSCLENYKLSQSFIVKILHNIAIWKINAYQSMADRDRVSLIKAIPESSYADMVFLIEAIPESASDEKQDTKYHHHKHLL